MKKLNIFRIVNKIKKIKKNYFEKSIINILFLVNYFSNKLYFNLLYFFIISENKVDIFL